MVYLGMRELLVSKLSDFDLDLKAGKQGENLVQEILGGDRTVEVKTDLKWKNTGNVYIETTCWSHNNKSWYPSGLTATKADYWAFVLEGCSVIVPTDILRKAVELYGYGIDCKIEPNPSKGYLIRPEQILKVLREFPDGTGKTVKKTKKTPAV